MKMMVFITSVSKYVLFVGKVKDYVRYELNVKESIPGQLSFAAVTLTPLADFTSHKKTKPKQNTKHKNTKQNQYEFQQYAIKYAKSATSCNRAQK